MTSEATSSGSKFQNFPGGACPHTPLGWACLRTISNPAVQDTDDTDIVSSIHQSEMWKKWYDSDGFYKGVTPGLSRFQSVLMA